LDTFAGRLLHWFELHGRHNLPWQQNRNLYRVWVAEIMLQQTQVTSVIPYYLHFMRSFPDIDTLAAATAEEVLAHWAGLGYYSRARNLHKTARKVVAQYQGNFPQCYDDVLALPGIGPSTAAAILAQALNQPHAILDGNVKRVLCRYHAIEGWSGQRHIEKCLWQKAIEHTPQQRAGDYAQAIMDLGATVCTRSSPQCTSCPLSRDCVALSSDKTGDLPTRKPGKVLPVREKRFLVIQQRKAGVLMEKRPASGIWGGLWSLPETDLEEDVIQVCEQRWGLKVAQINELAAFRHTFSHFHLNISPCVITLNTLPRQVNDALSYQWQHPQEVLAVAAPVRYILDELLKVG